MTDTDAVTLSRRALMTGLVAGTALAATAPALAQATGTRLFEDDLGAVEIPVKPQRIVSLNDVRVTIPLIEMGVMPVGSQGRIAEDGTIYLRSGMALVRTDFHNSPIQYVGSAPEPDLEKIVALEPDLIITYADVNLDQFKRIAPTLVLNPQQTPGLDFMRKVADAAGVLERFEELSANVAARMDALRTAIPEANGMVVSLLHSNNPGEVTVGHYDSFGALGFVLSELGCRMPALTDQAKENANFSAESLQQLDGDFIISTYNNGGGATPASMRAAMEATLANYCDVLHACRTGQYVSMPRDEVYAFCFAAIDLAAMGVHAGIAGRNYQKLAA